MKVSSKGLELIKEFEGFSSVAYLCSAKKGWFMITFNFTVLFPQKA